MFDHASLDRMFRPRSIALIGASTNPDKIGGVPLALLLKYEYDGKLYPVNPNATEVQGVPAYPSVAAIGAPADLAIVAVPMALAEQAVKDAAEAGVRSVVLFTSGYAEVGETGRAAQARLAALARTRGVRILGPNCLGFMNTRDQVYATFSPAPHAARARPGAVGIVSQSGAFGIYAYAMARERDIGLSYWISTGNECDIEFADAVAWLARDPDTRVIMGYVEGCRDGAKLKAALSLARDAGKPVVVTKVGRTASGAAAAASHTAALAGDDAVFDALLRQYGAIRTRTLDEFFNVGYALSGPVRPANKALGIMTLSGGVGALMADDAADAALELVPMPAGAQAAIMARVPFATPRNPVDITGQVTSEPELMTFAARTMLDSGGYGSLLAFLAAAGTSATFWPHLLAFAKTIRAEYPDTPLALCSLFTPERRRALEALGCLVFADPSAAVRALKCLGDTVAIARPACDPGLSPNAENPAVAAIEAGVLDEPAGLALLRAAGIPVVAHQRVASQDEAVAAAAAFGYPVVMKLVSADITHKSDIGAVRLHLQDAGAVRAAYREILEEAARHAPAARLDGLLVAPMIKGGVECILGVQRDPVYGPVVMFGLGGVLVEAMRDVAFRMAPFDERDAHAMIDEIRGRRVLAGMRGQPPADVSALASALAALSRFAWANRDAVVSVDVNPFIVLPLGGGALALDAVVIGAGNAPDRLATA